MKPFDVRKSKYSIDLILDNFGLERGTNCNVLQSFVQVSIPPDFVLPDLIEEQRQLLEKEGDLWNEEELKMHFLSFVFKFSDIQVPKKIKLFYERPLAGIVQDTSLSVICDALLAAPLGINTPKTPYFFLQEFKKGKKAQNDAEGQMLVAMLIAQEQNKNGHPIYGCYLQGGFWYFATLLNQNYCLSKAYDATQIKPLIQIIHILKNLKNIVVL